MKGIIDFITEIETAFNEHIPYRLIMSTVHLGDMSITSKDNRRIFLEKANLPKDNLRTLTQKHSRKIIYADTISKDEYPEGDGIITDRNDLILGITVADCVPIILYSADMHCFCALHSGWKGTGICTAAAEMMINEYKCKISSIRAVIGPSIGSCCYHVGKQRANLFQELYFPESVQRREDEWFLDLKITNYLLSEFQNSIVLKFRRSLEKLTLFYVKS